MRKREQLLWDAMKRNLPSSLWLQRVENLAGDGMPDVYVGATGAWVELKAPSKIPVRASTPLLGAEGLRTSQLNWFLKNTVAEHAPPAFVLIRTIAGELLMIRGDVAADVNKMSLAELRVIAAEVDWPGIARRLARGRAV